MSHPSARAIKIKQVAHVLIEKVMQLFRHMPVAVCFDALSLREVFPRTGVRFA